MHFAYCRGSRIGQVAIVAVYAQRTQALGIRGGVSYRMQHLHVADVVNVQALLQTYYQSGSESLAKKSPIAVCQVDFELTCSASPPRSCLSTSSCIFRCLSWSGTPSASGGPSERQSPPDCCWTVSRLTTCLRCHCCKFARGCPPHLGNIICSRTCCPLLRIWGKLETNRLFRTEHKCPR